MCVCEYVRGDRYIKTWNAVSNCSHGTVSQFGYAFSAAVSLYAPGMPCNWSVCKQQANKR